MKKMLNLRLGLSPICQPWEHTGTEMPDSAQHKYHLPCVGLLLHLVLDCTISWALRAAQSSAVSFFLLFLLCVWGTGCGDKLAGPFVLSLLFRVLELATNSELSFGFVAGWSFDECCM